MANLKCDYCGGPTNTYGSWDTNMTISCSQECKDRSRAKTADDHLIVDEKYKKKSIT